MKHLFAPLMFVLSCVVAVAADPSFTSTLSADELKSAGLENLTQDQIQRLDSLVERFKTAEVKREVVKVQKEAKEKAIGFNREETPDRIETKLVGTINSYNGSTIFEFENGQAWQQTNHEQYRHYKTLTNPSVIIDKAAMMGFWLYIDGFPRVRVKRIR